MLVVYQGYFPTGYLLVLAPSAEAEPAETALRQLLGRACHCGKPTVWLDCRLLPTLSAAAVRLLWACHHRLRRRGERLVLCHVSDSLRRALYPADGHLASPLCVLDGLDQTPVDAER